MTLKEREDRFIENWKKEHKVLSWEAELLLRFGFSAGAAELNHAAYKEGMYAQQTRVLDALGVHPKEPNL